MADTTTIDSAVAAVRADQQASPSPAPVVQQAPYPVDQFSQLEAKQTRQAGMSKADYLGAMWRQDSWIPGAIDHWAGNQLQPDANYNPYDEQTNKALVDGVWPEFQGQFAQATSAGQAAWIKENILQKQKDLENLGDLSGAGNVGRFAAGMAFGLVDPVNLAAMAVTGGASQVARVGIQAARTAEGLGAAARAAQVAEEAAQASRLRPTAAGLGTAGALGAYTEQLRQQYNFEDDSAGVLKAGLMSMAFAAPFVGLHAHEQLKAAKNAGMENQAYDSLAKLQRGEELSPEEHANLHSYLEKLPDAAKVDAGVADQSRTEPTWGGDNLTGKQVFWDGEDGQRNYGDVAAHDKKTGMLSVENPDTGELSSVHTNDLHELSPGKTFDEGKGPTRQAGEESEGSLMSREEQASRLGYAPEASIDSPTYRALHDSGVVTELRTADDLNKISSFQRDHGEEIPSDAKAVYIPQDDRVYVFKDRLTAADRADPTGMMMHEVGVHYGLERALGTEKYMRLMKAVDELSRKDPKVAEAAKRVPGDTPEHIRTEEILGYLAEHNAKLPAVQRLISAVRNWLRDNVGAFRKMDLTTDDVIRYVQGSLNKVRKEGKLSANLTFPYVWHGSPVKGIDQLKTAFIGTGEGRQSFGHGHYVTSEKGTALDYRNKEAKRKGLKAEQGGLYRIKVNTTRDRLLNWEKPVASQKVAKFLKGELAPLGGENGQQYHERLAGTHGAPELASKLDQAGVHGIEYETGRSRGSDKPNSNFVLFHDRHLDVAARYSRTGETEAPRAEGFAGSPQPAGSEAAPKNIWEQTTAMAKWKKLPTRWDFFTHLNQSENPHLQELGFKLVKDAIGLDGKTAQGWSASELKSQYRRELGGAFHVEARRAYDDALKARKMPLQKAIQFHRQFYEDVSRVARGDTEVLKANPDIAPQLQRAAKAQTDFYADMKTRLEKAGVRGAENLPDNPQYVNRQWRQDNIRAAFAKYGNDMYQAVANAIQVPGLTGDIAKSKSFLDAVMKLEFSHAMQDMHLYSKDLVTLREELTHAGLSDHEINSLVDLMFDRRGSKAGDAGQAPALKYRFALNENHMERMADGSTFKLSDLFENDSRVLVDRYLNSMGGHLALAEVGIRSRAEFAQKMRDAEKWHGENAAMSTSAEKFNRNKQFAQDLYDHITGRPMSTQSFNRADRFLTASRAVTRSTMLGQLGLMATLEMKNAIALSSVRAMRLHMPTFMGILRSFRAGHEPTLGLAKDIEMITGFGREHVAGYSRQHEITDYTYDRGLSRYENAGNTLSHIVDHFSGNSHVTSASRNLTARMMVQKHLDFATERAKMSEKQRERMVHQGVSLDEQRALHDDLKKYTEMDQKNGAAQTVNWEDWSRESPETYSKFQLLLSREVRDAIQDHDIGESIPFMHTTVGKIFTELKTFVLAGHAKQFLKSLHYRDSTTFVQWAFSFVGAALEYSLQQSINYAHDPEKLKEKLSPSAIAWGAIPRMPVLGLMPNLMETVYNPISGGQTLFTNGTANTDNRNLFITPTMTQAMRMMSAGQVLGTVANPFSTNTITQKDMRDALYSIPGGNMFGMRNVNDMISSNFPKFKPRPSN